MTRRSLFSELRERKVFQVAAIYGAGAWGLTEVIVTIVQQLFLPQWISTLAVISFVVGFPIAMFLAWTFDITSEGIRRTDIKSGRGTASIALSMLLLVAGTTGLFFLIKPALDSGLHRIDSVGIAANSVAVLPFDYTGPDQRDSHLGPGLSDELRDQLGRVEGVRIAARSSSIAAVRDGADAVSTAQKLGVAHVLEGNMRRQGNLLRVSVQLIDGASGLVIWNDTFDRDRRELLNLQQDIAAAVVRTVIPGFDQQIAEPATRNATANELMLLGRYYEQQVRELQDVDVETLQQAVHFYRQATEADPESALARSRLAGALLLLGDIDGADAEASVALLLDPSLAEVQYALGKILYARGDPNMGQRLARAVELNPNLPEVLADYASWHWFNVGTHDVADLYRRALDLDPLNVARYAQLAHFLAINDRPDDARALAEQIRVTFDGAAAYRAIAHIMRLVGDVDHAIAWTIIARDSEPSNPLHVQQLAEYFTDIGDYETAFTLEPDLGVGLLFKMRRYDEMIDKAELQMIDFPNDMQLRVYLAFAYSLTGKFESALRIIEMSRVLDGFSHTRRNTEQSDAFDAYLDAAYGSGEIDEARELTRWRMNTHYDSATSDWWVALGIACRNAILGNDGEVYSLFQLAQESNHLAWEPMLKDQHCFRRFGDDPAYLAVVRHFDERRALLRERVPSTLAQYGVSL